MSLFQSDLRKQIRKLPKILKSLKIIQYCSIIIIYSWGQALTANRVKLTPGENRYREAISTVPKVSDQRRLPLMRKHASREDVALSVCRTTRQRLMSAKARRLPSPSPSPSPLFSVSMWTRFRLIAVRIMQKVVMFDSHFANLRNLRISKFVVKTLQWLFFTGWTAQ